MSKTVVSNSSGNGASGKKPGGHPVNVNDYVFVKLTAVGRELHRKEWLNTQTQFNPAGDAGREYAAPVEDADGWSRWQLWELMSFFGSHLCEGCDPPFDTTILLEESQ